MSARLLALGPPVPARRMRSWFACGRALPWVRTLRHDWTEDITSDPAAPLIVCQRCGERVQF